MLVDANENLVDTHGEMPNKKWPESVFLIFEKSFFKNT